MPTKSFDTHAVVQDLCNAGMPEVPAAAFANALHETRNFNPSNLATKADLLAARSDLAQEFAGLRADLYRSVFAQTVIVLLGSGLLIGFLH